MLDQKSERSKEYQNLGKFLKSSAYRNSQTQTVDIGSHILYIGIIGNIFCDKLNGKIL